MQLCIWEISKDNALVQRNYQRIRHVWRELAFSGDSHPDEADFVCLLGSPARTVVYDISLPASLKRSAEREVLFGELAARLPVPAESVCWFYRACGDVRKYNRAMQKMLEYAKKEKMLNKKNKE